MTPAAFEYLRVGSVEEAVAALVEHGDDAKLLAGGHSLLPLMKLRLAQPAVLVDLGELAELSYVREVGEHVAIGALTRHHEVERHPLLRQEVPLLAHAASHVGDPQVRHRGTIGGSLAHGDGASDLPAVVLALGGSVVARGPAGEREIPVGELFEGFLQTALAPDEVLTEVRVPRAAGAGWSYQKLTRRSQDWAIVGVAAQLGPDGARIGLVNMASTPVRAAATEAALAAGATTAEAAAVADEGTEPADDLHGSAEYRRHLARVLVERALEEAGGRRVA